MSERHSSLEHVPFASVRSTRISKGLIPMKTMNLRVRCGQGYLFFFQVFEPGVTFFFLIQGLKYTPQEKRVTYTTEISHPSSGND